ncbi:MAG: hypothetical protein RLZZ137_944 [Cyanobacteriota bacterium]
MRDELAALRIGLGAASAVPVPVPVTDGLELATDALATGFFFAAGFVFAAAWDVGAGAAFAFGWGADCGWALGLVERLAGVAVAVPDRLRWLRISAHSASLRPEGLLPWALTTFTAVSISAIRFFQEVAKRLSDWDLAPLSSNVSTTPAAETFLRRRLKISFCSCAIKASALSLSLIVS